ncbi:PMEL protein, partial [Toxostoma redivivum]|nr:PMEL protein [Toxostoma redivivum]
GGDVTFDISNDAPTMAGARATFSIALRFPGTQRLLPDGRVVWGQNCTVNGQREPKPPQTPRNTPNLPRNIPEIPQTSPETSQKYPKPPKKLRRYWQVVDGAASQLTVGTAGVPLGSYTMEVVVYHYRGRQKFIPIGHASSQFSITGGTRGHRQWGGGHRKWGGCGVGVVDNGVGMGLWVQVALGAGTAGDTGCSQPAATPPAGAPSTVPPATTGKGGGGGAAGVAGVPWGVSPVCPQSSGSPHPITCVTSVPPLLGVPSPHRVSPVCPQSSGSPHPMGPAFPAAPAASGEPAEPTGGSAAEPSDPAVTEPSVPVVTEPSVPSATDPAVTAAIDPSVPAVTELSVPSATAASTAAVAPPVTPAVATAAGDTSVTAGPVEGTAAAGGCWPGAGVGTPGAATVAATAAATAGATAGAALDATAAATLGVTVDATIEATVGATVGATAVSLAAATAGSTAGATAGATAQPLALVKRQAPAEDSPGCVLYRYGTFATELDIVQGIESVAIVQVVPEGGGSSVELTVTCEGGLPEEVCTVVADAECRTAEAESCSAVSPSPGCELVLRQDFNRSGLFCLNVSLANGNGLAVATTRVAVGGAAPATGRTTLFVGLVLVAAALGTAAYTYR